MSNLQPNCCLEFDFRKVDQHAGGKWLIHDTKRRKGFFDKAPQDPGELADLPMEKWPSFRRRHFQTHFD